MAIGVVMDFAGGTLQHYDQLIARMGFAAYGAGATGGLFHWVAQTEDGVRVTDVWESREACDAFVDRRLGPLSAELGLPRPSNVTYYEVHNFLTAGEI
ncbi:MAG: hypothetical protein QOH89_1453 [Pseudonocardiales bacterium]|jgi:hypothetical protein|nr:hypothetical protein [Pseudonocardiales bacterium]